MSMIGYVICRFTQPNLFTTTILLPLTRLIFRCLQDWEKQLYSKVLTWRQGVNHMYICIHSVGAWNCQRWVPKDSENHSLETLWCFESESVVKIFLFVVMDPLTLIYKNTKMFKRKYKNVCNKRSKNLFTWFVLVFILCKFMITLLPVVVHHIDGY